MSIELKTITRVAIFAALVFVSSYLTVFLSNIKLAFFIVFSSGLLWGALPGVCVGVVGLFLWSNLNPLGPVPLPLLMAQLIGISFSALIGAAASKLIPPSPPSIRIFLTMALCGFLTGLLYHLPVDIVDAWLIQPFWPRLIGGSVFSLITIISNCIIFPMLYPALLFIYRREKLSAR